MKSVPEAPETHVCEFGVFRLDPVRQLLWRHGEPIPLNSRAVHTLVALIQHRDRVLTKDELMRMVWGEALVEENNLNQSISAIRKTLGESPSDHQFIITVPGQGYRFVAEVTEIAHGKAPDSLADGSKVIDNTKHTGFAQSVGSGEPP